MGLFAVVTTALFAPGLQQAPLPALPVELPEVVLSDVADDRVPITAFGLGNGGLDATRPPTALRWSEDGCTTPGDVRVQVLTAGVKLTFPSGRELLVAPDGHLHLRDGAVAGPFPTGLELHLADGAVVRIGLARTGRNPIGEVTVVHGERALQPWRRGRSTRAIVRAGFWGGVRLCCCGDGGEVYRAIAIGPLITLDRVLVPTARERDTPEQRLVVLTAPMMQAMSQIPRQSRAPDQDLRQAVRAVSAMAVRGDAVFPDGAALRRAERDALRWGLPSGYELELALDGPRAPRLSLFAGRARRPMVEWTLGNSSAAYLNNPRADEPGASRWHGNGVPMPMVAPALQVRRELLEHAQVLRLIRRLQ
ncbi:MAG: hypothetical protein KDC98_16185 [Planctomycetes bacterium]|nr:hypothetical protein [Planctomycetota bacterium]